MLSENCIISKYGKSCIYYRSFKTNYFNTNNLVYQSHFIDNNFFLYFKGYILIKLAFLISKDIFEKIPEIKNITF